MRAALVPLLLSLSALGLAIGLARGRHDPLRPLPSHLLVSPVLCCGCGGAAFGYQNGAGMKRTRAPFHRDSMYRADKRLCAERLERDLAEGLVKPSERHATIVQIAMLRAMAAGHVVLLHKAQTFDDFPECETSNVIPFVRP